MPLTLTLDPQSPTALRIVSSPVLSDAASISLVGAGAPIVFNRVRLVDDSLLLLVLGAVPLSDVLVSVTDGAETAEETYSVPADPYRKGAKLLEALTYAFGKQVQFAAGVPSCVLRADLGPFDTTVYVDSTIGFPAYGWVRIGERLLEYVSRTSQSFQLSAQSLVYPYVTKGTGVFSAVHLITPDGAGFGTESL
jgi:hypothetical protein